MVINKFIIKKYNEIKIIYRHTICQAEWTAWNKMTGQSNDLYSKGGVCNYITIL